MRVDEFGQILEATESELYEKFWKEEYNKMWSFATFLDHVKGNGTRVLKDNKSIENLKNENFEMFKLLKNVSEAYKSCDMEKIMTLAHEINTYMEDKI